MKETRIQSLAEISHFTHRKNRQAHTALLRRVLKFINHQSIYYSINNGLWPGRGFLRGTLPGVLQIETPTTRHIGLCKNVNRQKVVRDKLRQPVSQMFLFTARTQTENTSTSKLVEAGWVLEACWIYKMYLYYNGTTHSLWKGCKLTEAAHNHMQPYQNASKEQNYQVTPEI